MIAGPGGPSSEGWIANCHALAWDSGPQDGADCEPRSTSSFNWPWVCNPGEEGPTTRKTLVVATTARYIPSREML